MNDYGRNYNPDNYVVCCCGYHNRKCFVELSGVCKCCGTVLDDRAKFKYEMNKRLKLWKGKLKWKS